MKTILYFLPNVNNFEDSSVRICKLWRKLEVSIVVVNNIKYSIWTISDEDKPSEVYLWLYIWFTNNTQLCLRMREYLSNWDFIWKIFRRNNCFTSWFHQEWIQL